MNQRRKAINSDSRYKALASSKGESLFFIPHLLQEAYRHASGYFKESENKKPPKGNDGFTFLVWLR